MNYYVITEEIFNTLIKDNISFCLKSIDNTKRLISTTDIVNEYIESFENINTFSQYTFNPSPMIFFADSGVKETLFSNVVFSLIEPTIIINFFDFKVT